MSKNSQFTRGYGSPLGLYQPAPDPIEVNFVPGVTTVGYQLGQILIYSVGEAAYILVAYLNGQAIWVPTGGGALLLSSLVGNTGSAVPNSGIINIVGTGAVSVAGSGSSLTISSSAVNPALSKVTFASNPIVSGEAGAAAATTLAATNLWGVNNGLIFEAYNLVALTTAGPVMTATGLNLDSAVGKVSGGIEVTEGILSSSKSAFVAQTSPAFFVQATFNVATLADATQVILGFRKTQAYNATLSTYTDFATIGVVGTAGELELQTNLASGGVVTTDTTQAISAATNFTLRVNVSAAGVVTYLINGSEPSVTAAYTLAAETVVPFIQYRTPAGGHAEVDLVSYQCGLQ